MKLKKLLCLLLAVLMLFALAACGEPSDNEGGNGGGSDKGTVNGGNSNGENNGKDPEPSETTTPEDDTVWVLVKESDMGSSRYTKYHYDENGNLTGGEFFKGSEKWGDYQYVTTETASGGKLVEELYKHVDDSEFTKQNEYEYDAAGRLIRTVDYDIFTKEPSGWVYTFTYNEAGQLVEQVSAKDGEESERMTFVYDGDKLTEGHYTRSSGNYGHYLYTYDGEGNPVKVDVHTYAMDYEAEYTLDFELNGTDWFEIRATEDCHNVVGGRRLFYYEERMEDDKPYEVKIQVKAWGIFCTGWIPLVSLGCMNPSNYFIDAAELVYMPLDVYLAQQEA